MFELSLLAVKAGKRPAGCQMNPGTLTETPHDF
jgi:hypothetical protein